MTAMPIAEAARLLGKPERTVRRWAAAGKLNATRTADGWLVDLDPDEHGQVAATGGQVTANMADWRQYVADLRSQLDVKDRQISELHTLLAQAQHALPEPQLTRSHLGDAPRNGTIESVYPVDSSRRAWWRIW